MQMCSGFIYMPKSLGQLANRKMKTLLRISEEILGIFMSLIDNYSCSACYRVTKAT